MDNDNLKYIESEVISEKVYISITLEINDKHLVLYCEYLLCAEWVLTNFRQQTRERLRTSEKKKVRNFLENYAKNL